MMELTFSHSRGPFFFVISFSLFFPLSFHSLTTCLHHCLHTSVSAAMKRTVYEDVNDDRYAKQTRRATQDEGNSTTASPAYSIHASSPAYRYPPKSSRNYTGCSKLSDYDIEDKLGEGTFG